jgi:hypothetical protein
VRGTLSSMILETNIGRGHQHDADCRRIVICYCWQPWRGISGGTTLSAAKGCDGSGLNKEDPGRAPPLSLLHSTYREGMSLGASSEESVKQRCVLSLKQ